MAEPGKHTTDARPLLLISKTRLLPAALGRSIVLGRFLQSVLILLAIDIRNHDEWQPMRTPKDWMRAAAGSETDVRLLTLS